ncbi:MAG: SCP2 sterol-binding domain-containing protein [Cypionkella sp.]|jgi:putative sterol carrier protein
MSDVIEAAVKALSAKLANGFDGVAKFVIEGEGAIMVDPAGVRAGDEPADVTLTASAEVFQAMLAGEMNPTTAFMTGKLSVDGSMPLAMQLGAAIS